MSDTSPIIFFIFNRPKETKKVFRKIAEAKPGILLVVADGPRNGKEAEICRTTRSIVDKVNWKCDVRKNFSEENLGLMKRVTTGLDWAFNIVEEAIILEDDCLPHQSFFKFCSELLERYRFDERIKMIGGSNFYNVEEKGKYSYFFSRILLIWGWATWKRAWLDYEPDIEPWTWLKDTDWLHRILEDEDMERHFTKIFNEIRRNAPNSWSNQWYFSCWAKNGYGITPKNNLISNIGFGDAATHTKYAKHRLANYPVAKLKFPISHPNGFHRNSTAEKFNFEALFLQKKFNAPTSMKRKIELRKMAFVNRILALLR